MDVSYRLNGLTPCYPSAHKGPYSRMASNQRVPKKLSGVVRQLACSKGEELLLAPLVCHRQVDNLTLHLKVRLGADRS
jgi:hypothetical protein